MTPDKKQRASSAPFAFSLAFSGGKKQASFSTMSRNERRHFLSVRQWVYDRIGLNYPEQKHLLLYNRLSKLCWRLGISGIKELDQHLQNGDFPGLDKELARAVSTSHTYFFREERVLQFFQDQILPTLPADEQWRLWSAAASSGEEAFTIAMILAQALGDGRAWNRAAILGTDIDRAMIEQAERGVYAEQRLEHVPPYLRHRYFQRAGSDQWRVDPGLQQMCTFRRLNLMSSPWPFRKNFHVILCRNILYYFDTEHQQDLAERLYDVTVPGGWLLTSVTEPVQTLKTRWRAVTSGVHRKT
ncbi:MAG: protein-glutamate O-methyltransferase CheR [Chloroflexi bacterium]|nr:protein-glutamate O-methyltransferase CheR [Chloroflexota bacterium]